jgi:hypothetical protein
MFSRRRFLQTGTIAAGTGIAALATSLSAEEPSSLPPSIASLKSM